MLSSRFAVVDNYPFRRLAALLEGTAPAANVPPVDMSIGEPRHSPPTFLHDIVARNGPSGTAILPSAAPRNSSAPAPPG